MMQGRRLTPVPSPVVSNIYMEQLEELVLPTILKHSGTREPRYDVKTTVYMKVTHTGK